MFSSTVRLIEYFELPRFELSSDHCIYIIYINIFFHIEITIFLNWNIVSWLVAIFSLIRIDNEVNIVLSADEIFDDGDLEIRTDINKILCRNGMRNNSDTKVQRKHFCTVQCRRRGAKEWALRGKTREKDNLMKFRTS